MLIYNMTVKVQDAVAGEWLQWMLTEHGPEMVATGCFTGFTVLRLLEVDDDEGPTYAVQFVAGSPDHYRQYLARFSESMSQKAYSKWGKRFIAFRTVMEVVKG